MKAQFLLYKYFQAHQNYFWQWEEQGKVLAIPNGNTIAYRPFIAQVLEKIQEQGIPSFGALLFAIIATNETAKEDLQTAFEYCKRSGHSENVSEEVRDAFIFLKRLSQIPADFKKGDKRIQIFQTIFEDCHNLMGTKKSKSLLRLLKEGNYEANQLCQKKDFNEEVFQNDIKVLRLLKNKFKSPEDIVNGVASLPEIDPIYLGESESVKEASKEVDLLEELLQDDLTFHIGALIKRIWSGMNIPMHAILPNEQKLGGVADLTNKGTFDKLLISEFANDDLTFLSRLANQEALYLNRERPPNSDSLERFILVDSTIKTWGTPRTIAYAIMIAIAKHPKSKIDCQSFALGKQYHPIEYDNIRGIINGLNYLKSHLDAAEGLEMFLQDHKAQAATEIIFITATDNLRSIPVQKVLQENHQRIRYIIATDANGEIDIYRNQNRSRKHLQKIQLPLKSLWAKPPKPAKKFKTIPDKDLVLIEINYPLLFPHQRIHKFLGNDELGSFCISTDKKLFRLAYDHKIRKTKGWDLIHSSVPREATFFEIGKLETGPHAKFGTPYILCCYLSKSKEIVLINLNTGEEKRASFIEWGNSPYTFIAIKGIFYYQNYKGRWQFNFHSEKIVSTMQKLGSFATSQAANDTADLRTLQRRFPNNSNFLKNVKSIYINRHNRLVFNNHELFYNQQGQIKIRSNTDQYPRIQAEYSKGFKNVFEFPDGSRITVNRSGILILKSSNQHIPEIYIPSVLNSPLGLATKNEFSGSDFYFNPYYNQEIQNTSTPTVFYEKRIMPFITQILKSYSV